MNFKDLIKLLTVAMALSASSTTVYATLEEELAAAEKEVATTTAAAATFKAAFDAATTAKENAKTKLSTEENKQKAASLEAETAKRTAETARGNVNTAKKTPNMDATQLEVDAKAAEQKQTEAETRLKEANDRLKIATDEREAAAKAKAAAKSKSADADKARDKAADKVKDLTQKIETAEKDLDSRITTVGKTLKEMEEKTIAAAKADDKADAKAKPYAVRYNELRKLNLVLNKLSLDITKLSKDQAKHTSAIDALRQRHKVLSVSTVKTVSGLGKEVTKEFTDKVALSIIANPITVAKGALNSTTNEDKAFDSLYLSPLLGNDQKETDPEVLKAKAKLEAETKSGIPTVVYIGGAAVVVSAATAVFLTKTETGKKVVAYIKSKLSRDNQATTRKN